MTDSRDLKYYAYASSALTKVSDSSSVSVRVAYLVHETPEGTHAYAVPPPDGRQTEDDGEPTLEKDAVGVLSRKNRILEGGIVELRTELEKKDQLIQKLIEQNHELQNTMTKMFQIVVDKLPEVGDGQTQEGKPARSRKPSSEA